jgi:hypothetical protein
VSGRVDLHRLIPATDALEFIEGQMGAVE